jgi:hypothetical protein
MPSYCIDQAKKAVVCEQCQAAIALSTKEAARGGSGQGLRLDDIKKMWPATGNAQDIQLNVARHDQHCPDLLDCCANCPHFEDDHDNDGQCMQKDCRCSVYRHGGKLDKSTLPSP